MIDKSNVIATLRECLEDDAVSVFVPWETVRDALELLKEQEPVEPKKRDVDYGSFKSWDWICGVCGGDVIWGRGYCPNCGQAVKWE